jgi:hypothetical protein
LIFEGDCVKAGHRTLASGGSNRKKDSFDLQKTDQDGAP